jgi:biotin carboxyl carrier protein
MKLKAQIGNDEFDVTVDGISQSVTADIGGRLYDLDVRELSSGVYLFLHENKVYRCRVAARRNSRTSFDVSVRGRDYGVTIVDPKRLRSGQTSGTHGHGVAEIVSPMPGKVVKVLVDVGQKVEAHAGIVVVEAMKMQNELKSPKAGVVAQINFEAGATVNAGDVLAVIE